MSTPKVREILPANTTHGKAVVIFAIVAVWLAVVFLAWCLCRAAARGDR